MNKAMREAYPGNWEQISYHIRFERAGGKCERCGHVHGNDKMYLATAHLDGDTTNNDEANLMALCPRCHLKHDNERNVLIRERKREEYQKDDAPELEAVRQFYYDNPRGVSDKQIVEHFGVSYSTALLWRKQVGAERYFHGRYILYEEHLRWLLPTKGKQRGPKRRE